MTDPSEHVGSNSEVAPSPYDLHDFDIANPDTIQRKLADFCNPDPAEFLLIADFDNTLTNRGGGIWESLRNTLPEAGKIESDRERTANLRKERAGELSVAGVIEWSKNELERYVKHQITRDAVEQAAKEVQLRHGTQELFKFCADAGIESHILSASVADAIEIVANHNKLSSAQVHSNRLRIKDGVVIDWNKNSMFHNLNKHEHAAKRILRESPQEDQRRKIILGDNRHDADVVPGDNALRIRVQGKNGNSPAYLENSFAESATSPGFDLVLRTESLQPVVDLLERLVA